MKKTVLVTGGTGFIGRQTLPLLHSKGFEVHFIGLGRPTELSDGPWNYHSCNLLNFFEQTELLKKLRPTHLLHFAWDVTHGEFWKSPKNHDWVLASETLLRNFSDFGGKRAVFAGTCAEYGSGQAGPISEQQVELKPETLYGVCKNSLRNLVESHSKASGLLCAWGRIFFLYGPYENPSRIIPSTIHHFMRGETFDCKNPTLVRDFLHVSDVASAFVALLESNCEGPINIASGNGVSLKTVIDYLSHKMDGRTIYDFQTKPDSAMIADISRLKNEVGWVPSYDLSMGLDSTIEWWLQRSMNSTINS